MARILQGGAATSMAQKKVLSALGIAGASPNLVQQVVLAVADRQEPEKHPPPAGKLE